MFAFNFFFFFALRVLHERTDDCNTENKTTAVELHEIHPRELDDAESDSDAGRDRGRGRCRVVAMDGQPGVR